LPQYLLDIIDHPHFTFIKKNSLALSAVVDLAYNVIDKSFAKHGKLIVRSSMPDPDKILYSATAGSMLTLQFQLMGLATYLRVENAKLTEQEQRYIEKNK